MAANGHERRHHAVVIGASMGGLLAARALADYYEQVTVLERDSFPPPGAPRKGVPQGRHAHGLLASGRDVLEGLFPGLTAELVGQGGRTSDISELARWHMDGAYLCRFHSGLIGLVVSRPLLEAQVRTRLLALPNVRAIEDCDVRGVVASADRSRITGVRLKRRAPEGVEEVLEADLVVDAGGRGSQAPAWLADLGYPAPEEERVRIGVGYTSRVYRRTPTDLGGDLAAIVAPLPGQKRGGVMIAQEGERWIVTLFGYVGDHAPTDEAGFLAYAKSLPAPDIYTVIKDAEPLSELVTYKYQANQRRRYERLARLPEGLLVFGDALCSFDPVYGQGMSVAALETRVLQQCLASGAAGLPRRFFQQASKVVDIPWSIAVGGDLRIPEVEGQRTAMVRFINWYMSKLQVAAHRDPVVTLAFHRVTNLLAPPPSILHPRIAVRVLWGNLRPARRNDAIEPTQALALTHS